ERPREGRRLGAQGRRRTGTRGERGRSRGHRAARGGSIHDHGRRAHPPPAARSGAMTAERGLFGPVLDAGWFRETQRRLRRGETGIALGGLVEAARALALALLSRDV